MILFGIVALITCCFAWMLTRAHLRARRVSNITWQDIVARIQPVKTDGVTAVALDHLAPTKNQLKLEPEEIWEMIGGLEGLQRMRENANLLIALAVFAERWNIHEGVIVAERMRRDGLNLRRAVRSIERGLFWQNAFHTNSARLPFHLHDAAASYYLMRQRLLALYETSHAGLYPRLAEVL